MVCGGAAELPQVARPEKFVQPSIVVDPKKAGGGKEVSLVFFKKTFFLVRCFCFCLLKMFFGDVFVFCF